MGSFTHWYLTRENGWVRGSVGDQPDGAVCIYRYEQWGPRGLRNELRPIGMLVPDGSEHDTLVKKWGPCPRRL